MQVTLTSGTYTLACPKCGNADDFTVYFTKPVYYKNGARVLLSAVERETAHGESHCTCGMCSFFARVKNFGGRSKGSK